MATTCFGSADSAIAFTLVEKVDWYWQCTDFEVVEGTGGPLTYYIILSPIETISETPAAPLGDGTPTVDAMFAVEGHAILPESSVLTLRLIVIEESGFRSTPPRWQQESETVVAAAGRISAILEASSIPRPEGTILTLAAVFDPTIQSEAIKEVVGWRGEALEGSSQLERDEASGVNRLLYESGRALLGRTGPQQ